MVEKKTLQQGSISVFLLLNSRTSSAMFFKHFQTPYCDKLPINWFFAGSQPPTVSLHYKIVDVVRDWETA